jgi:hypothetical protein
MRRMVESLELDSAPEHRRELASAPLPPATPPAPLEEESWLDKDWRKQTLSFTALIVTGLAMLQLYIVYVGGNIVTVYKCEAGCAQPEAGMHAERHQPGRTPALEGGGARHDQEGPAPASAAAQAARAAQRPRAHDELPLCALLPADA